MKIKYRPFTNHVHLYYVQTELGSHGIVGKSRDGTWRGTGLGPVRKPAPGTRKGVLGTVQVTGHRTRQGAAEALVAATAEVTASRPGQGGR